MINVDIKERENVFIVSSDAEITAEAIVGLSKTLNDYINMHDRVPNLVFRAHTVPHWKNFDALKHHFQFVRNHHKLIKKIAVVSDSKLIWLVRPIVDHFTGAKVRRFPEKAFDDAVNWAEMEDDHPGEFIKIDGLPDDVVAIDARGLITAQDYEDNLVPLVETKLKSHDKLKLLMVAGNYFNGYSGGAMWDDARLGLSHYTSFSKVALVTDVEWMRHSAKLFGPLMPAEVMVFNLDELEDARAWIAN